ncbi:PREDICTED: RILP-like protein 2 [Cariama cristata]|uniref:RILP-like protein 2 n=1 Tax=Cariama cristata TaxID=54380 RepID=UPI00052090B3|nr:PREDICTED: RILP-like protein 2 [Cariama cristata]
MASASERRHMRQRLHQRFYSEYPLFDRLPFILQLSLGPDKMVIDLTDPNRPRFTLQELRDVLQERNQLKAQLLVVQEELQCYKSGIISQRRDQAEELEKEASGSSPATSKDSEEKTIIKRLFSFKHGR